VVNKWDMMFKKKINNSVIQIPTLNLDSLNPQDFKLAERIASEGKACVIVVNKWDTVPNKETNTIKQWEEAIRDRLRTLSWAPMIFISATTGQRVPK
jgi:predicted GTPase